MFQDEPKIDLSSIYAALYDKIIKKDAPYRRLKELIDFSFIYDLVIPTYTLDNGRPGHNPVFMFKLLLIKILEELSDRDVIKKAMTDLALKFFLDLNPDEDVEEFIDPSSLTYFRKLRLNPDKNSDIINTFIAKSLIAAKKCGIKLSSNSVIDSTHTCSRFNSYFAPVFLEKKAQEICKYLCSINAGYKDLLPIAPDNNDLMEHITYGFLLLQFCQQHSSEISTTFQRKLDFYEELISDSYEELFISKDRDASLGYKSKEKPFFGYKTHFTLEPNTLLVTAAVVTEGKASDSNYLIPLISQSEANGAPVEALTGDGAYSSRRHIEFCTQHDIALVSRLNPSVFSQVERDGFTYNKDANAVICPAGKCSSWCEKETKIGDNGHPKHYLRYVFNKTTCKDCTRRETCLKKDAKTLKSYCIRINIPAHIQPHIELQKTDQAKLLAKERYKIEQKNAELKNRYGMKETIYNNLDGMQIQAAVTLFAVNMKRILKIESKKE